MYTGEYTPRHTLEGTERVREKSTSPRKRKGAKGRSVGMSMHARAHTRSRNETQTAYSIGLLWRAGRSMAGETKREKTRGREEGKGAQRDRQPDGQRH